MGVYSRLSLPENFFDWTSDMLLLQPEPQYLYARLWKRAMGAELVVPDALGAPGREIMAQGAQYASADASRLSLAPDLFDATFAARVEMSGMPGHTVRINRPKFLDGSEATTARRVATNQSISTTPIDAGSEQIALTLGLYAGPYDTVNSRIAPYGIDAFDAQLGVHKLSQIVGMQLKRDMDRWLERVHVALLDAAGTTVRPAGMTADNDATASGQFPFDLDTFLRAELTLDEANIPYFADGYRCAVLTPRQVKQLADDQQYARYAQFNKEYNALFPGYVASVHKTHIFKSNSLTVTANSSSVNIHKGHMFGPGALASAIGRRPTVRAANEDNYGMTAKVIWTLDGDFVLADSRFAVSVRSSA
jgi:N4-gp56 family major capsid protein